VFYARHAALATVTTAGLLAAGCGSNSSSDQLTKADMAKKADAICVTYNAKVKALAQPSDAASFKPYLEQLLPFFAAQRKELVALKPDDAVKAEWDGLIKDYDEQALGAKQALAALTSGDEAEFQRIVEAVAQTGKASDVKLDAFGASHCGSKSDA
jgi:hypothetical protein